MSRPAPLLQSDRPDLQQQLLVAVAEGDAPRARRLGDQLAHRLGVLVLERFLAGPLQSSQGPAAVAWLQAQLGLTASPLQALQPLESAAQPLLASSAAGGLAVDEEPSLAVHGTPAPFVLTKPAADAAPGAAVMPLSDAPDALVVAASLQSSQTSAGGEPALQQATSVASDLVGEQEEEVAVPPLSAAERLRDLPGASPSQPALVPPAPAPALVRRLRAWLPEEDEPAAGEDQAYPKAS
jgi:hypothetical protein